MGEEGIQSNAWHDTSVKYNLVIESCTNAIMADKYMKKEGHQKPYNCLSDGFSRNQPKLY